MAADREEPLELTEENILKSLEALPPGTRITIGRGQASDTTTRAVAGASPVALKPALSPRGASPSYPSGGTISRGRWNIEKTNLLIKLWEDGLSASQIAWQLNEKYPHHRLTRNAIIGKKVRLQLETRAGDMARGGRHAYPKRTRKTRPLSMPPRPPARAFIPVRPSPIHPRDANKPSVPLIELKDSQCHAIITEDGEPVGYCGDPKLDHSWCCAWHYSRYYIRCR